jgi:hypothetical protein
MSGDTKSIAIKDARAMGKINTTQMAKDLGYADANAMAMDMGYTKIDSETGATVADLDAFNKAMQDNLNNASNDFAKAFNTADKYGISGMRTSILSLNDSLMSLGSDTGLTIA